MPLLKSAGVVKKRVCHFEVPWKCKAHSTQTYGYQERDDLKRQAFQEQLKTKPASQIVYVDEAGIDNRE